MAEFYDYEIYQAQATEEFIPFGYSVGVVTKQQIQAKLEDDTYKKVAIISATDLEDVFDIGNHLEPGPQADVIKLTEQLRSVSVGDVIKRKYSDEVVVVADFGFDSLYGE